MHLTFARKCARLCTLVSNHDIVVTIRRPDCPSLCPSLFSHYLAAGDTVRTLHFSDIDR